MVDGFGVRMKSALAVAQQAEEVLAAGAAGAEPVVVEMLGGPAFRAGPERCRVLAVTRAAERAVGEPGGDGAGVTAGCAGHAWPAAGAAQRLAVSGACPHGPAVAAPGAWSMAHPAGAVLAASLPADAR